jgi:hypothetical protein
MRTNDGNEMEEMTMSTPTHEEILALVRESGIDDATGTLYTVCRQAIVDGDGTPEAVRRIWADAARDARADRESQ